MRNFVRGSLKALPFAAAALAAFPTGAFATLFEGNANIFQSPDSPFLYTENESNGVGRTFRNVIGDYIRFSAQVFPSRDSVVNPVDIGNGNTFRALNGNDTVVDIITPSFILPTTFVGITSGLGGLPNEYTVSVPRNIVTQTQLDALDATPIQFRIRNAFAPNGITEIFRTGPDYDQNARPGFINNISISGGGLNPTLNWSLPLGEADNNAIIQIRKLNGNVADGTFTSTFISSTVLAPGATSYIVNNADFHFAPGINGLELGAQYEVAVQLGIHDDNDPTLPFSDPDAPNLSTLRGISRTFFEFTPLAGDIGDVAVYLPSVETTDEGDTVYHFDIEVTEDTPVVIDPIIAVGYDYQIGVGDGLLFSTVSLPSLAGDDGFYDIYLWDGISYTLFIDEALAGNIYDLVGVDRFRVLGIDQAAMLDPTNTTAFLTTLTFTGTGSFTGTMTAVTLDIPDVPEPMTLSLLGAGLAGVGWARRKRAA